MLLPCRRLDCCDDLACHAELRKGTKGRKFIRTIITDRLEESDHPLLHNVLAVCPDEKVGACFGAHEVTVLVDKIIECLIAVTASNAIQQLLVRTTIEDAAFHSIVCERIFFGVRFSRIQLLGHGLFIIQQGRLLIAVKNHTMHRLSQKIPREADGTVPPHTTNVLDLL